MNNSSSLARDYILNRIKKGLEKEKMTLPFPEDSEVEIDAVFEKNDLSDEEVFALEFTKLGGKFVFCKDEIELTNNLIALQDQMEWPQILCSDERLISLFQQARINFVEPASRTKHRADVCITLCESIVARTGSILFTSHQKLGRMAPVFYPIHIVIAFADQLVGDIAPALNKVIEQRHIPSMINLNTGPSRTADIEKTLVVGVHGPGEVYCFLLATRPPIMR